MSEQQGPQSPQVSVPRLPDDIMRAYPWLAIFDHHAPDAEGLQAITRVREGAKAFAAILLSNAPRCADLSTALRCTREAMMWANAAIVLQHDGRARSLP